MRAPSAVTDSATPRTIVPSSSSIHAGAPLGDSNAVRIAGGVAHFDAALPDRIRDVVVLRFLEGRLAEYLPLTAHRQVDRLAEAGDLG